MQDDCLPHFEKYSKGKPTMDLEGFTQLITDVGRNLSSSVIKQTFKFISPQEAITQDEFIQWYFSGLHLATGSQRGLLKMIGHKQSFAQAIEMTTIGKQKAQETKCSKNNVSVSFRS